MKMLRVLASATVLAFAFASATSIGEIRTEDRPGGNSQTAGCKKQFAELDANGNGLIEKEEVLAAVEAGFVKMDKNNDGTISMDDVLEPQLHQKVRESLSNKKLHELMPEDVDKDGKVTLTEYQAYFAQNVPEALRWDAGVGLTLNDYCARMEEGCRRTFAEVDENGNGVIEQDELWAVLDVRYRKRDRDQDGKITMDDVLAPPLHPEMRAALSKKAFHGVVPEDMDKDGSVDLTEYRAYVAATLKKELEWDTAAGFTLKQHCERSGRLRER